MFYRYKTCDHHRFKKYYVDTRNKSIQYKIISKGYIDVIYYVYYVYSTSTIFNINIEKLLTLMIKRLKMESKLRDDY